MRALLLHPEGARKAFYIHLRQAVRAFHNLPSRSSPQEVEDHDNLVRRIAFIDLKNTGGGPRVDKAEIMEATKTRRGELVAQILLIEPSHIAVAGQAAQEAFGSHIRQHTPPSIKVCGIRHPSWRYGNADEYYRRVQAQMASAFPDVQPGAGDVQSEAGVVSPKPSKPPAPPARIPSPTGPPPTVSVPQLDDWRRRLLRLLREVDRTASRPTDESVAGWIARLSRSDVIPRHVAAFMRTVTETRNVATYERNVAEYDSKTLSPAESAAVLAAWAAIQEWAQNRGFGR